MNITNILKTDSGWEYYFDSTASKDIFLDGIKIVSGNADNPYELVSTSNTPPEIEIVTHNTRGVSSWAGQYLTIQWFRTGDYNAVAIEKWNGSTLVSRSYMRTEGPERYYNAKFKMSASDSTDQTWMVKPARRASDGSYRILGGPIPIEMRRHYLPKEPDLNFSYDEDTGEIMIYE